VSKQRVRELAERYSNWGRWGDEDEIGALNLITPERVRAAAALVRRGAVFSLAIPLDANGPQTGHVGRTNPLHVMLQDGGDIASGAQAHTMMEWTDDAMYLPLQSSTQWDALAHIFFEGRMYNGHGTNEVTSAGARRNSIDRVRDRIVGRGVLLDLPRAVGRETLEPSERIDSAMLERCAAAQGVEVGAGDIVLVRTGAMRRMRAQASWEGYVNGPMAGLSIESAAFFCERDVAAIAIDTWTPEVVPVEVPDVPASIHVILLVYAGITIGEIFDLEDLASDCADDGVYEFLVSAPPLRVTAGVGSPINPVAIK
jgi:kynurenine formamidase